VCKRLGMRWSTEGDKQAQRSCWAQLSSVHCKPIEGIWAESSRVGWTLEIGDKWD
jgi:hypothetical protein